MTLIWLLSFGLLYFRPISISLIPFPTSVQLQSCLKSPSPRQSSLNKLVHTFNGQIERVSSESVEPQKSNIVFHIWMATKLVFKALWCKMQKTHPTHTLYSESC